MFLEVFLITIFPVIAGYEVAGNAQIKISLYL